MGGARRVAARDWGGLREFPSFGSGRRALARGGGGIAKFAGCRFPTAGFELWMLDKGIGPASCDIGLIISGADMSPLPSRSCNELLACSWAGEPISAPLSSCSQSSVKVGTVGFVLMLPKSVAEATSGAVMGELLLPK